MKKQILALTMCLTLTATSVLADSIKSTPAKPVPTQSSITNPKPVVTPSAAPKIEARKHFEEEKAKERQLMYAALNLSEEQKAKAEELDAKTKAEAVKYLRRVHTEAKKLRDLKAKHASIFAIYKQKLVLRAAKVDTHNYLEQSRKSFESILTKEQKDKFRMINAAKKEEMEKFKKEHKQGWNKKYKDFHEPGFVAPETVGKPSAMKK